MAVIPVPNWNAAYANIGALSSNYETTLSGFYFSYNNVEWNSTYTTVLNNSATWVGGTGDAAVNTLVHSNSGNWESVYTTVNTGSGSWTGSGEDSAVNLLVHSNSGNWESTFTTVQNNSAAWMLSGSDVDLGQIPTLSGNWNSTYTTVNANSSLWILSGTEVNLGDIPTLSANWNSVYTEVNTNSANWSYQGTDLKDLSSSWQSTYTTVNVNSSIWDNSADVSYLSGQIDNNTGSISYLSGQVDLIIADVSNIAAVSASWNSNYTTVNTNSALWGSSYTLTNTNSANWNTAYTNVSALSTQFVQTLSAAKEPTGFEERTSSTISFNDATRTFTFSPTGTHVWSRGIRTTYSTPLTTQINATTGAHYFYFNESGTYSYSDGVSWDLEAPVAPIAYAYWNGANSFLLEERHGCVMDGSTHRNLHLTRGTQLVTGLLPYGYTIQTAGTPTVSTVSFGVTQGTIADEDIFYPISQFDDNNGVGDQYHIFYRAVSGSGIWTWQNTHLPYLTAGAGFDIAYNRASDWAIQPIAANNTWMNIYVFATSTIQPTGHNIILIPSQATYGTLLLAQAETINDLSLGSLPFAEVVALAQFTYRRVSGNATTGNARLESYKRLIGNSLTIASAAGASNHNSLAGLQGGTAGEYYHLNATDYGDYIGRTEVAGVSSILNTETSAINTSVTQISSDLLYSTVSGATFAFEALNHATGATIVVYVTKGIITSYA